MNGRNADLVVRAGTVHTLGTPERPITALAARGGTVVAVAGPSEERDLLREWTGPETITVDDPGLVVLPAFVDTHNHLMLAARNTLGVPVSAAHDLTSMVELIRRRAADTPAGEWIVTAADWHELQLAEKRLPTAAELDRATSIHPVLVLRGGHNAVLNSVALRLAGIGPDTPDVPGGFVGRDAAGRPTGWLQDAALEPVARIVPPPPEAALADGLAAASAHYAAHGIGTVRDPAVTPHEWHAYRRAEAAGRLSVASHTMIWTMPEAIDAAGSVSGYLDGLEAQGITPKPAQGRLRVWGLKFVLDGGVEAAALSEPYADRPGFTGRLLWERADLVEALATCVKRGWPVGTHALGDRAIALLLEAIRVVTDRHGRLPPGMLVIEHGGLITPEQIAEAVALGVHITVQQALLTGLAAPVIASWGPHRAAAMFPFRELLDAGAWISAGTDHPVVSLDPLQGVHDMTTRHTPMGTLGAEHAITRAEALRLYTTAGAHFLGRHSGTPLTPGAPADLVAYPVDPLTCPVDQLTALAPALTAIEGRITHQTD
ncbi:amidohydrolase [Amycolatopsis balhimycina DSM 5908]|uniref:Amidohydrolase n=1 Tax=Amycolatopsis balhimycina DSM 5908 TaxID=1081091 RepID=A0A428WJ92_AMYBA|nr:amidohydrolase [Amycolatopsis balhimycina]RSM43164.1 amidohydrolase [Amycolatopsis balhimycina DSM 5908]